MGQFELAEHFVSINGEGRRAGELAVFLRFAGCNLNCRYCDTKWANEKNVQSQIIDETALYQFVKETGISNVTITGGEPLLQRDMKSLLYILAENDSLFVEIETNGSMDLSEYIAISENITFTVDYKLPSSGMESFMCMQNYSILRDIDTVKFVVGSLMDLERGKEIIETYLKNQQCAIYISPVHGEMNPVEMIEFMKLNCMNHVKIQLQLQKYIWNPNQKGV